MPTLNYILMYSNSIPVQVRMADLPGFTIVFWCWTGALVVALIADVLRAWKRKRESQGHPKGDR